MCESRPTEVVTRTMGASPLIRAPPFRAPHLSRARSSTSTPWAPTSTPRSRPSSRPTPTSPPTSRGPSTRVGKSSPVSLPPSSPLPSSQPPLPLWWKVTPLPRWAHPSRSAPANCRRSRSPIWPAAP